MDQRYRVKNADELRRKLERSRRVVPHGVRSLARHAQLSPAAVVKLLEGRQETVDAERAELIAEALGCAIGEIFFLPLSPSGDADAETAA